MLDKLTTNKMIQKHLDRAAFLNKKSVKIAKKLNNCVLIYERFEENIKQKVDELNIDDIRNIYQNIIDELNNYEKEQTVQIIRLKQQIKNKEKKNNHLETILLDDDQIISDADTKNSSKISLRLHLLKATTGIYIDGNTPPNIIRGFSVINEPKLSMKLFEFDISKTSEEQQKNSIWELTKSASTHLDQWEKLFSIES